MWFPPRQRFTWNYTRFHVDLYRRGTSASWTVGQFNPCQPTYISPFARIRIATNSLFNDVTIDHITLTNIVTKLFSSNSLNIASQTFVLGAVKS